MRAAGAVLLPAMLPSLSTKTPAGLLSLAPTAGLAGFISQRLAAGSEVLHEEVHREIDRVLIPLVMEHTRGNRYQAAKVLGIARQTLRRRLREFHTEPWLNDAADDTP